MNQLKAEEKIIYDNLTEALQNPTDVRFLELGDQLRTLPKEIGKLQNLVELHLDDIPALKSPKKRFGNCVPR
ncbi:hypothetical protein [Leptospira weilii]|uniref:hypothetical protein n=1 Tax=Leptospira weilii TaxID=28184 RepID=UPI000ADD1D12|nr:hypothetical protein [Leptospira weilii]